MASQQELRLTAWHRHVYSTALNSCADTTAAWGQPIADVEAMISVSLLRRLSLCIRLAILGVGLHVGIALPGQACFLRRGLRHEVGPYLDDLLLRQPADLGLSVQAKQESCQAGA